MSRKGNAMQPNQQRAIDLLLGGQSCREVAEELGVNRSTVWRWQQEPGVADELRAMRGDRRHAIRESVDAAALDAVGVLYDIMRDEMISPAVRVRAARVLLERARPEHGFDEPQEICIVSKVTIDDLTEQQILALQNCPDGLDGLRPRFPDSAPPPPR